MDKGIATTEKWVRALRNLTFDDFYRKTMLQGTHELCRSSVMHLRQKKACSSGLHKHEDQCFGQIDDKADEQAK